MNCINCKSINIENLGTEYINKMLETKVGNVIYQDPQNYPMQLYACSDCGLIFKTMDNATILKFKQDRKHMK